MAKATARRGMPGRGMMAKAGKRAGRKAGMAGTMAMERLSAKATRARKALRHTESARGVSKELGRGRWPNE